MYLSTFFPSVQLELYLKRKRSFGKEETKGKAKSGDGRVEMAGRVEFQPQPFPSSNAAAKNGVRAQ